MEPQTPNTTPGPPVRALRTIRFAVREAWDVLGLLCAVSFTVFLCSALPIYLSLQSILLGVIAGCLLAAPLFAGACYVAHRVYERDEPTYLNLWQGFRRFYLRAAALAAAESFVFALLAAHLVFYGARRGFGFVLASILIWYLIGFWAMNCLYHYPLLVAAMEGLVKREDHREVRLRAVLRNGFILAFSSPGYSLAILMVIILTTAPLVVSAVGMALIGCAFPAFLCTRATRDQLIRHGLVAPDPDPDEPVGDEVWKMRG